VYLRDGWADLTEIWNVMCPTLRNVSQQNWCSFVQALLSYRCVKMAFSWFLYNTHLSIACLHWLYIATRHIVVCLDELSLYAGVLYTQPSWYSLSSWPHSDVTSLGRSVTCSFLVLPFFTAEMFLG